MCNKDRKKCFTWEHQLLWGGLKSQQVAVTVIIQQKSGNKRIPTNSVYYITSLIHWKNVVASETNHLRKGKRIWKKNASVSSTVLYPLMLLRNVTGLCCARSATVTNTCQRYIQGRPMENWCTCEYRGSQRGVAATGGRSVCDIQMHRNLWECEDVKILLQNLSRLSVSCWPKRQSHEDLHCSWWAEQ